MQELLSSAAGQGYIAKILEQNSLLQKLEAELSPEEQKAALQDYDKVIHPPAFVSLAASAAASAVAAKQVPPSAADLGLDTELRTASVVPVMPDIPLASAEQRTAPTILTTGGSPLPPETLPTQAATYADRASPTSSDSTSHSLFVSSLVSPTEAAPIEDVVMEETLGLPALEHTASSHSIADTAPYRVETHADGSEVVVLD